MQERLWTAVLVTGTTTQVVNTTASMSKTEAQPQIENRFPGYTLIALVPGCHADGSYAYHPPLSNPLQLPNCSYRTAANS